MNRALLSVTLLLVLSTVVNTETVCLENEFFNVRAGTCYPCSTCHAGQVRWIKCTALADTICGPPPEFLKNIDMPVTPETKLDGGTTPKQIPNRRPDILGLPEEEGSYPLSSLVILICIVVVAVLSMVAIILAVHHCCVRDKARDLEYGPIITVV